MDCCRRGCPLNKSTNKNANVNIFSHNFFLLEWGMKITHYIDRQQREQLTTYTVNEKHYLHAWFCHLHKEWYETFLGVSASQRTKENLEILSPPVSVAPPSSSFVSLENSWNFEWSGGGFLLLLKALAVPTFRGLLGWRTIHFSLALRVCVQLKSSLQKMPFLHFRIKINSNNLDSEIWSNHCTFLVTDFHSTRSFFSTLHFV